MEPDPDGEEGDTLELELSTLALVESADTRDATDTDPIAGEAGGSTPGAAPTTWHRVAIAIAILAIAAAWLGAAL